MSNAVSKGLNLSQIKTNALSGLTTALAMVPETIAFAFVAHVSPLTGLYASVIVSFITSTFGGRPGMISGAAGSLAVVMTALVVQHGVEYLFAAVVLMGVLQVLFGVARMGKYIRMVPYPVMLGFVNGLAMVIFFAQFNHFKVAVGDGSLQWMSGPLLYTMLGLVALTMVIIYLLPRMTKVVPSALAAIVLVSVAVAGFGLETKTVGDLGSIAGGLPSFHIPSVPFDLETLKIVFPYSLILAAIGLIETLLTLNLVDEMTNTRGQPNRESMAQGAANVATGMFSGMGGCAMIGQTMINMNAGGLHRLSGIAMSAFLLSFILFASHWIEMIPLAALIGVIFVMALKTFEWGSFRLFGKVPRPDIFVGILVALITLFSDLAVAVLIGVIVSALVFAWEHAKQVSANSVVDESGRKVYVLKGSVFFASIANFQALFTPHDDPAQVVVDFAQAKVVDHSALAAIDALAERYAQQGKQLSLKHLSPDCRALLGKAKDLVEVNLLEDPTYPVADDKLG